MGATDRVLYESLQNYFNVLTKLGYLSRDNEEKLLVLIFIYELLEMLAMDYNVFLPQEDFKIISKALSNLYGSSCVIPYPKYRLDAQILCCDND